MQETVERETGRVLREFYTGPDEDVKKAMDSRLKALKDHTLVRRIKIGRNDKCPCNSGRKFKKCCIENVREVMYETRRD